MSCMFRKTVSMELPKTGRIEQVQGVLSGVWTGRDGRRQIWPVICAEDGSPILSKRGAVQVRYQTGRLYGKSGGIVVPLGVRDKSAARTLMTELDRNVDMFKAGMISEQEARQLGNKAGAEPIGETIAAYLAHLQLRKVKEAIHACKLLSSIAEGCSWRTISDMSGESLTAYLTRRTDLADATRSRYIKRCKAFGNWLVKAGRLERMPFAAVHEPRQEAPEQRRHLRRALSAEEALRLISATVERSPVRARLYAFMVATGLRIGEASQILISDFSGGMVTVRGSLSKTGRTESIPVRSDVMAALSADFKARNSADRAFMVPRKGVVRQLKGDLAAAGIPYKTDRGYADMHALRVSCASLLAARGVHLSLVQSILRHRPTDVTGAVYIMFNESDRRQAVESIFDTADMAAALQGRYKQGQA